jgi:hypothetical protein
MQTSPRQQLLSDCRTRIIDSGEDGGFGRARLQCWLRAVRRAGTIEGDIFLSFTLDRAHLLSRGSFLPLACHHHHGLHGAIVEKHPVQAPLV